jgi:hypothetical protein
VTESDSAPRVDPVLDLERRQDEVLRELEQLSQRLDLVLKQYAEDAAASKYAAACAPPKSSVAKSDLPSKAAA